MSAIVDPRGYVGSERNRTLGPEEVLWAREAYQKGEVTARQLAKQFGMSVDSVRRMLRSETYANVGEALPRAAEVVAADAPMRGGFDRLLDLQRKIDAGEVKTTPPIAESGGREETTHEEAIRLFLDEGASDAPEGAKKGE